MRFRHSDKHVIDFIFPLTLLLVFAVSALIVLLLSARIYASQTTRTDENYQASTPLAYITEKFRANDEAGAIQIEEKDGTLCLAFHQTSKSGGYTTYLYVNDGWLRELVVRDGVETTLESGKKVIEAKKLQASRTPDGLYRITVTDKNGTQVTRLLAERSRS